MADMVTVERKGGFPRCIECEAPWLLCGCWDATWDHGLRDRDLDEALELEFSPDDTVLQFSRELRHLLGVLEFEEATGDQLQRLARVLEHGAAIAYEGAKLADLKADGDAEECLECDGDGVAICGECAGVQWLSCPTCNGTGKLTPGGVGDRRGRGVLRLRW